MHASERYDIKQPTRRHSAAVNASAAAAAAAAVAATEPASRKRLEPGVMREVGAYSPHFRHHSKQLLHWRNHGILPSAETVSSINEDGEVSDVKTIKWLGLFRDLPKGGGFSNQGSQGGQTPWQLTRTW